MSKKNNHRGIRGLFKRISSALVGSSVRDEAVEHDLGPSSKKGKKATKKPATKKKVTTKKKRKLTTYAVCVHKGGVGKTTTAMNMAGVLAEKGKKVLLIDADAQGDLTGIFLPEFSEAMLSTAELYTDTAPADEIIQPTQHKNIDIIPADRRMEIIEKTAHFFSDPGITALKDAVTDVTGKYDAVIIDCATRPYLTGYSALVAADVVVVPLEGSQFSFSSVASIRTQIENVKKKINPKLKVRYFLSRTRPSKLNVLYRTTLIEVLGEKSVLKASIPEQQTITTATNLKKPVVQHAAKSKAAEAMRNLVKEL